MKAISLLLLTLLTRGFGQQLQEFAFTQCECQSASFPSTGDSIVSVSNIVPTAATFDCGLIGGAAGSNGFPDTSGITIKNIGAQLEAGTFDSTSDYFIIVRTVASAPQGGVDTALPLVEVDEFGNNIQLRADQNGVQLNRLGTTLVTIADGDVVGDYTSAIGAFPDPNDSARRFFFVCGAATGQTPACQRSTGSFGALGEAAATLTFIEKISSGTLDTSLKGVRIETGLALNDGNFASTIADAFLVFDSTPVVPPVNEGAVTFTTPEDTQVTINLNDALEPSTEAGISFQLVDVAELVGTISTALDPAAGTFTYDPSANKSGIEAFSMTYGIGSCQNSNIALALDITPLNDAPDVNSEITLEVFAAARVGFRFADVSNIATDVDFPPTNVIPANEAVLTVTPPQGVEFSEFTGESSCSTTASTTFDIVDSAVSFCILAPDSLFEGTVEVQISVDDQQGGVTQGVLTLQGSPPISVDPADLATPPEAENEENQDVTITVAQLVTAEVPEANGFEIEVRTLPAAADGALVLNGDVQSTVPFTVTQSDTLLFRPEAGVFNALKLLTDELSSRGTDNVPIGDCAANERDSNGFCPISFDYVGTLGDFTSADVGTVSLFVTAVDDLGTAFAIVNEADTELDVVADEGDNDAFGSLPAVTLTSDNGESVFPVEMTITARGGANFQFTITPPGLELVNPNFNGADRADCRDFQCTEAVVRTTPNQFQRLLSTTVINVDLDANIVNPEVSMQVENDVVKVLYNLVIDEEEFFEDPANVGIVAGSGIGLTALIVGFVLYRVRRADNLKADREIARATLNVQDEIARGTVRAPESQKGKSSRKKGAKGSSSRNKGSAAEEGDPDVVENIGRGWEKHYDAKTKAYFYYNPSTDTTQWDFPEDLNSGRKQRLGTQDLNI